jgi:GNAT superfamily N-acetyltransferase
MSTSEDLEVRPGGADDAARLLALFDDALAWLVGRGQTGQWGSEPFSAREANVERARGWARDGGLWFAVSRNGDDAGAEPDDGGQTRAGAGRAVRRIEDAGAIVLGEAFEYVPPPDRPELYVQVLLTRASYRGRGVGRRLVDHAADLAREQGAERLRVDCWDGTADLPAAYERLGFTRVGPFDVKGWPGAILVRDV